MPIYILTEQMSEKKNQMPRVGFEPTTPRSHGRYSGVSRIFATKETLITRHLLPGLSDWELLLGVVETHCYLRGPGANVC